MSGPVKYKVVVAPVARTLGLMSAGRHSLPDIPATLQVLDTQPGALTWRDKLKSYWHTAIVAIGTLLAIVSTAALPAEWSQYVSTTILILTTVLTALKSNEVWISEL